METGYIWIENPNGCNMHYISKENGSDTKFCVKIEVQLVGGFVLFVHKW